MDFVIVVGLASLLIGLSKGGLGGPVPIALVTPLLSQVMAVPQAVSLALPLLMIGDVFALRIYWKDWDARQIRLLLPTAILGVVVGSFLLATLPDIILRRIVGSIALSVIIYKLVSARQVAPNYILQNWHGYAAGGATGFASTLANIGSPPFTAYLLLQDLRPQIFIGTSTAFFAIVNALKLPGILIGDLLDYRQLVDSLWAIPLIPLGAWLGRRMIDNMNPKVFEWLMIGILAIASLALLFTSPVD